MHKSVIGLIGIGVVIMLLMSMMMSGAEKFGHRDPRTDSFSVTTGGGETTAIVGTQELPWKGLTSSVQTITSKLCRHWITRYVSLFQAMKLPCRGLDAIANPRRDE